MTEFSSCLKCEYQTSDPVIRCPQCRGAMLTSRKARNRGWVLVIAGGVMVLLMAFVIPWEIFAMLPGSDTHWEGTTGLAVFMFTLEGLIFFGGLAGIGAGAWQVKYGKRNKSLSYATMALLAAAVVVAIGHQMSQGS